MASSRAMASGSDWKIDEHIARAQTLPGAVYGDPVLHREVREKVLARSWQLVGDAGRVKTPGYVLPRMLLPGCLDEPVVVTRDAQDRLHCLSNVCTHRGNVVVEGEGSAGSLRCRYHGRRFGLDGKMQAMPEFDGVEGFPAPSDDLPRLPLERWGPLFFTSLGAATPFERWIAPVRERIAWFDLSAARFDAGRSRDYLVAASWALYCDNYLEGFHVPFVHAGLARAIEYGTYRTELFDECVLQVGIAEAAEDAFEPPAGSPDHGQRVAAYWFWLFPNLMLNFYPWGLSVNVVVPLAPDRTRVSYLVWVADESRLARGAGADLDRVEREDEHVVEHVQLGVRSRLYHRGRYSPTRETGVHHFHRLLTDRLRA